MDISVPRCNCCAAATVAGLARVLVVTLTGGGRDDVVDDDIHHHHHRHSFGRFVADDSSPPPSIATNHHPSPPSSPHADSHHYCPSRCAVGRPRLFSFSLCCCWPVALQANNDQTSHQHTNRLRSPRLISAIQKYLGHRYLISATRDCLLVLTVCVPVGDIYAPFVGVRAFIELFGEPFRSLLAPLTEHAAPEQFDNCWTAAK